MHGYFSSQCRETSKRKNEIISLSLKGETHTIKEWSAILGISEQTLWQRKRIGYSDEEILSKENFFDKKIKQKVIQYDLNNRELARFNSMSEASKATGIHSAIIWKIANGYIKNSKHPYIWKIENK